MVFLPLLKVEEYPKKHHESDVNETTISMLSCLGAERLMLTSSPDPRSVDRLRPPTFEKLANPRLALGGLERMVNCQSNASVYGLERYRVF